jgi:hypothetical protein
MGAVQVAAAALGEDDPIAPTTLSALAINTLVTDLLADMIAALCTVQVGTHVCKWYASSASLMASDNQKFVACEVTIHCACDVLEHDPEKWMPVLGKDHAQSESWSEMTTRRDVITLIE